MIDGHPEKLYWRTNGEYHHKYFTNSAEWIDYLNKTWGQQPGDWEAYEYSSTGKWWESRKKIAYTNAGNQIDHYRFYEMEEDIPAWLKAYLLILN